MPRELPDERRCTAKSKQRQDRCLQYAVAGGTKCPYHGGKPLRGADNGRYRHGERARYVRTDAIAEVLADSGVPAEKLAETTMRCNLADRRKRRADLEQKGAVDLDVAERLDAGDRGDSVVLLKSSEQQRAVDAPQTGFSLTIAQPGANAVTVRTMNGPAVAIVAPDGSYLLDDGRGNWVRAISREVDGVDVWSALVLERNES